MVQALDTFRSSCFNSLRYRSMIDPNALSGFFIRQSRPQFPLIREQ